MDIKVKYYEKKMPLNYQRVSFEIEGELKENLFNRIKESFIAKSGNEEFFPDSLVRLRLLELQEANKCVPSLISINVPEGNCVTAKELHTLFDMYFVDFYIMKIGEEQNIFYIEFLPISMQTSTPMFEINFRKLIKEKYSLASEKELENYIAYLLQQHEEEKEQASTFVEEIPEQEVLLQNVLAPQDRGPVYELNLKMTELNVENQTLSLENKKYQNFLALNSMIYDDSRRRRWKTLTTQEIDFLQESAKYLEELWEIHVRLVQLLSEKLEVASLSEKRLTYQEIKQDLLNLRVKRVINEVNNINLRKIKNFISFRRKGKLKILTSDYEKLVSIAEFSHFIEEENLRLERLLQADLV